ncbi:MAG: hypothetical protein ACI4E3_03115 [Candidatus Fimousia sp.]|nr:hypothetical protein [Anaerostipes sp.]
MIKTQVSQTLHTMFQASYQITEGSKELATAKISENRMGASIDYYKGRECFYRLRYDKEQGGRHYWILDDWDEPCGRFFLTQKKGKLFKPGYFYIRGSLRGREYNIYHVGFGKEGNYYCIYERSGQEEEQVALIEKTLTVTDFKDTYDCYGKREEDMDLLHLLCLYIDVWTSRDTAKAAVKSKEITYEVTHHKELKEKYDPSFLKS